MGYFMAQTYRPGPGEVIPIETDVAKSIRRETKNERFFTWRNANGGWVVGYKYDDGRIFDAAFAGSGEMPEITRGTIDSLISMIKVGLDNPAPLAEVERKLLSTEKERLRIAQEKNNEVLEQRRSLRRRIRSNVKKDHPAVKV